MQMLGNRREASPTSAPQTSGQPQQATAPAAKKDSKGKKSKTTAQSESQPPQSEEFPPMDYDDSIPF